MQKRKALVWDNDSEYRSIYKSVFTRENFGYSLNRKTDDFHSYICTEKPDLLIIDLNYPKIDSDSLIEKLNLGSRECDAALICLMSHADRQAMNNLLQLGTTDILIKPFTQEDLSMKIESAMTTHRKHTDEIKKSQDRTASHVGYSVEHYLGQPLSAVIGAAQVLQSFRKQGKAIPDEDLNQLLDIIISASGELGTTIKRFGRIKEYKIKEDMQNDRIIEIGEETSEIPSEIDGDPFVF